MVHLAELSFCFGHDNSLILQDVARLASAGHVAKRSRRKTNKQGSVLELKFTTLITYNPQFVRTKTGLNPGHGKSSVGQFGVELLLLLLWIGGGP